MRWLVLLVSGCGMQMSVFAGPRVDGAGSVSVEVGASWGGGGFAVEGPVRSGALIAAGETAIGPGSFRSPHPDYARLHPPDPATRPVAALRAAVRGTLEWIDLPTPSTPGDAAWTATPGVAWRIGAFAGIEHPDDDLTFAVVGATLGVSPWVAWRPCCGRDTHNVQWRALGFRLASELVPGETGGHRWAVRAQVIGDIFDRER